MKEIKTPKEIIDSLLSGNPPIDGMLSANSNFHFLDILAVLLVFGGMFLIGKFVFFPSKRRPTTSLETLFMLIPRAIPVYVGMIILWINHG